MPKRRRTPSPEDQPTAADAKQAAAAAEAQIHIDKRDLAVLTEATRDCEESILADDKAQAIAFIKEIRAMSDFWRLQLQ
jgi:hypothetical protein